MNDISFSIIDYFAFIWFIVTWLGYTFIADTFFKDKAISSLNTKYRYQWMSVMIRRENRIVDTTIQGMLSRSASFFASTAMLIAGGCLASLGSVDKIISITQTLPLFTNTDAVKIEVKILLILFIYIYAFFKFMWSFRLFNSVSILIGAVPLPSEVSEKQAQILTNTIAGIHAQAARHFNNGIRSYMFSVPVLAWLVNPYLFIIATTFVTLVIQRREFYSKTHDLLVKSLNTYE